MKLDRLRGLAALFVLIYHIKIAYKERVPIGSEVWDIPFLRVFFELGEISVYFFMLLSGFVLSLFIASKRITKFRFLVWRVVRLGLMYYVFLFISVFVANNLRRTQESLRIQDLTHTYLFSNESIYSGVNPPLWSLSVEIFLSLIFALASKVFLSTSARNIFIMAVIAISFCYVMPTWGLTAICRSFGFFLIGIGIFRIAKEQKTARNKPLMLFILISIQITCIELDAVLAFAILPFTLPLLFLLSFNGTKENFVTRVQVNLGLISFSLYITHWPVLDILANSKLQVLDNSAIFFFLSVSLCLTVALISRKLFDIPIQRMARNVL